MRIAVVSDIHGNRTAFEAVLADLKQASPDVVLHGGDLADSGPGSVEIVDQIRSLGWKGVAGNTDQMIAMPDTFERFASRSPKLASLWDVIREMAAATRELLGEGRLAWLGTLGVYNLAIDTSTEVFWPPAPWFGLRPGSCFTCNFSVLCESRVLFPSWMRGTYLTGTCSPRSPGLRDFVCVALQQ